MIRLSLSRIVMLLKISAGLGAGLGLALLIIAAIVLIGGAP